LKSPDPGFVVGVRAQRAPREARGGEAPVKLGHHHLTDSPPLPTDGDADYEEMGVRAG
jgi:hypothetical protein